MAIVVGTYREKGLKMKDSEGVKRWRFVDTSGIKKERLDAGCCGGSPAARVNRGVVQKRVTLSLHRHSFKQFSCHVSQSSSNFRSCRAMI
jgi:hypothetical protein